MGTTSIRDTVANLIKATVEGADEVEKSQSFQDLSVYIVPSKTRLLVYALWAQMMLQEASSKPNSPLVHRYLALFRAAAAPEKGCSLLHDGFTLKDRVCVLTPVVLTYKLMRDERAQSKLVRTLGQFPVEDIVWTSPLSLSNKEAIRLSQLGGPSWSDEYDAVISGGHMDLVRKEMNELPFKQSSSVYSRCISQLLENEQTRSETYICFMNMIEVFFDDTIELQNREEKVRFTLTTLGDALSVFPPCSSVVEELSYRIKLLPPNPATNVHMDDPIKTLPSKLASVLRVTGVEDFLKPPVYADEPKPVPMLSPNVEAPIPKENPMPSLPVPKPAAPVLITARQAAKYQFSKDYHKQVFLKAPADTPVAVVDKIWLQVDPTPSRVIHVLQKDEMIDEILTSTSFGRFTLTKSQVEWVIDDSASPGNTEETPDAQTNRTMILPLKFIKGYMTGVVKGSRTYFLAFHGSEVLRFYPFQEYEIAQLTAALSDFTGEGPFVEDQCVSRIVNTRAEYLRGLAITEKNNDWIRNTEELFEHLRILLESRQTIGDLERLFHSCRLQPSMTKHAIAYLRKTWDAAKSEVVRLKILSVLERVLDPAVMHSEDPNLPMLSKWFQLIERNLDPFKSAQSLRVLIKLRAQLDAVRKVAIKAIYDSQYTAQFDYLPEFDAYLRIYGVGEE
eukprot:GFYU01021749.1.p1 GENE.GFYU01021749.1~~GFYU01021749.1.p1  ORF type:complete len:675 (+),score=186.11 GFYU01021749.1:388-2412(+)